MIEPFGQVSDWNFCLVSMMQFWVEFLLLSQEGTFEFSTHGFCWVPADSVSFYYVWLTYGDERWDWQIQLTLSLRSQWKKWQERVFFFRGETWHWSSWYRVWLGRFNIDRVHGRFNLSCQLQKKQDISYIQTWCWIFLIQNTKICKATLQTHDVFIMSQIPHVSISRSIWSTNRFCQQNADLLSHVKDHGSTPKNWLPNQLQIVGTFCHI